MCAEHGNVRDKKCTHSGCTKAPSYGKIGTKKAEFGAGHAKEGMVNVKSKNCPRSGCSKTVTCGQWRREGGVLCPTRGGWDGERKMQEVCPPGLHEGSVVRPGRWKGEVLCWACGGRDVGREEQAVRTLWLRTKITTYLRQALYH